jgi:hypothetical protein
VNYHIAHNVVDIMTQLVRATALAFAMNVRSMPQQVNVKQLPRLLVVITKKPLSLWGGEMRTIRSSEIEATCSHCNALLGVGEKDISVNDIGHGINAHYYCHCPHCGTLISLDNIIPSWMISKVDPYG